MKDLSLSRESTSSHMTVLTWVKSYVGTCFMFNRKNLKSKGENFNFRRELLTCAIHQILLPLFFFYLRLVAVRILNTGEHRGQDFFQILG